MNDPLEIFRSVEIIWVLWLVSLAGLCLLTWAGLRRVRWAKAVRIHSDEKGAAYALSYVMVVPLYLIFVCLVVETSTILVTKIGTVYAANAGARAAIVWQSSAQPDEVENRVAAAARQAMVPFATGLRVPGTPPAPTSSNSVRYLDAYESMIDDPPVPRGRMANRLDNVNKALDVEFRPAAGWSEDVEVTISYQFRFHVPVIGHVLGTRAADGYRYYTIKSTVRLQNEGPQNQNQRTGISYASPD
jgi:hypothetical protein